jgi:type I restriction enzyme S subunit
MPNTWKKYKLGDLIDVKHGYAFKGEFFSETPTKDILLSPGNFNIGGGFKADKFKYYKGVVPEDYVLTEGDLLITMTDLSPKGDTLGTTALIPKHDGINYLHNQRLGLVILLSEEISTNYLYWALRSDNYHNFIVSSATGSTVRHTSPSRIKDFEILLPPAPEQQAITEILSALDDKIELNLQTNKTLEDMANALYKHWFVDFHLAANEDTKLVKIFGKEQQINIPNSYSVINISEQINRLKPKTTYKKDQLERFGVVPVFDQSQDGVLGYHNGNCSFVASEEQPIMIFGDHTCKLELITTSFSLGPNTIPFIGKNQELTTFLYFSLLGTTEMNDYKRHWSELMLRDIIIPKNEHIKIFNEAIRPWLKVIQLNREENQTIKETREYLLPKLISGEIRVKEATKKVKELV